MQFPTSFLALGLALSSVVVATPAQRDIKTITGVIADITSKVQSLDGAIKAYNGGNVDKIQAASDDIVATTEDAITTVKGEAVLEDTDALQLTVPIQSLISDISDAIDALISKKEQVAAAGAGPQTYKSLQAQKTAAEALATALTSKVSDSIKSIAATLAKGISDAIQKGISAYEDVSTGGGDEGSSTTSAKPTSTDGGSEPTSEPTTTDGGSEPTDTPSPSYPAGTGGSGSPNGTGVTPPGPTGTGSEPPITNGASSMVVSGAMGVVALAAVLVF